MIHMTGSRASPAAGYTLFTAFAAEDSLIIYNLQVKAGVQMGRLCLSMGHEKIFLREEELAVCERQGRYTRLYHRYGQTDVRENLDAILQQTRRLQYCHQSFLVDPARIFRLRRSECQVRLPGGNLMLVPVSKNHSGNLLKALYEKSGLTEIP